MTCELQAPMKHWQIWVNHFFSWTEIVLLIPLGLVRISRNRRSVNWANWPVHPYFVKTWSTVQMWAASVFYPIMERLLWGSFEHFEPRRFQLQQVCKNRSYPRYYPLETLDPYPPKMFSFKVVVCRFELTSEKSPSESPDIFPTFLTHQTGWKFQRRPFGVLKISGGPAEIAQVLMHRRMYNVSSTPPITSTSKHTLWSVSEADRDLTALFWWVELSWEFFHDSEEYPCPWKWMAGILVY